MNRHGHILFDQLSRQCHQDWVQRMSSGLNATDAVNVLTQRHILLDDTSQKPCILCICITLDSTKISAEHDGYNLSIITADLYDHLMRFSLWYAWRCTMKVP